MTVWFAYPPEQLAGLQFELPGAATIGDDAFGWPDFHQGPAWDDTAAVYERLFELVESDDVLVPLTEEVVAPAAAVMGDHGCRGYRYAMMTIDRLWTRSALSPHLSPSWEVIDSLFDLKPLGEGPWYVKGPASTLAYGVRRMDDFSQLQGLIAEVRDNPYMAYVSDYFEPDYHAIVEEAVDCPQFEITGVVARGEVQLLAPTLRQIPGDGLTISGYERCVEPCPDLQAAVIRAAADLRMDWCIFCFELRRRPSGRVVVIDAHGRPGEELGKGYAEAVGVDFMQEMLSILVREAR